ncbi:hypothetical protein [Shewanella sp. CG12_big_fil_rev_8_21_14_0_65_47_15]|uniref:hypothetical protein n=1 Tax=Shewanella sp. CG12_big_fil_rev_8_21_14_0_65_47_15 TaxID=1975537 RepID=UPI000CC11808|nr:hypothetical protein [Shewanella sp. CG12_big_fil_rev_8_21_14_0_65_47_15]PIW62577.1 MAG: hypothetical protein COW15_02715 [Shewanella sp. CG12_big_fil_rev_8_21_14_0_65_47_15]
MAFYERNSFHENQLKAKLASNIDQVVLFKKIDSIPELLGASVIYIDSNYTIVELRPFTPICRLSPIKVVLREPPKMMSQQQFAAYLKGSQSSVRESKLVGELTNTVLSCGAAVLGWIVVTGSGAAIPLTGGTSSAITYLAVAASTASSVQCINGVYRSGNEIFDQDQNDLLDSQQWYQDISTALDVVSIAGAGAAAATTVKTIKLLHLSSGKSYAAILGNLSRAERKRLTQEIIRMNQPGISNSLIKKLVKTGTYPTRYSGLTITQSLQLQLKDAIGASMSFTGSALSGTIHSLAIGIYEEVSE